jgi:hypothetical protein
MRPGLVAAAAIMSVACASPVLADCSTEVALAVQAQGKQKFLRKETQAIGEQGPFKMTIEYGIPDRMRQIVAPLTENKPVEAVVVGEKAWTNNGDGWVEAPAQEAEQLVIFMIKSSSQVYQEVGKFECVGAETVDGRQLRAYRGLDEAPKDKSKDADKKPKNEGVRMIYLDPVTGLPARSIFARAGALDKPLFKEVYTYPEDIKIEPPKDARKFEPPKEDKK